MPNSGPGLWPKKFCSSRKRLRREPEGLSHGKRSRELRSLIDARHRTCRRPRSMAAPLRRAFFNECPDAGAEVFAAVAGTHQIVAVW